MAVIALAIEASRASTQPLSVEVNSVKSHAGENLVSKVLMELIGDSRNVNTSSRVQDPYSLRCIPQVLGSVVDSLAWSLNNVLNEVNSVSDNPVIIGNGVYSTCHFHGQYVAISVDLVNTSLAVLGNLIERRIVQLLRREINGVSNYLANGPWRVGLMLAQYTVAALTARLRESAIPSTVQNIPTRGFRRT